MAAILCHGSSLFLLNLAHLSATANLGMRHFIRARATHFIYQFCFAGFTTVTFAYFSGHFLFLLNIVV